MRSLVGPVPEPAERACSALRRCARAALNIGATRVPVHLIHSGDPSGDLIIAIPADSVHVRNEPATVEVLDVVLGGAADGKCRRVVTVTGTISMPDAPTQRRTATAIARELADPTLLDVGTGAALVWLKPTAVLLTEREGITSIDPEDLATSGPDPFTDLEGLWLAHLNDPRCPVLNRLLARVGRTVDAEASVLLGIDRAGIDLEVTGTDGAVRLLRLPFDEACISVAELGKQIRLLAGCPRSARPIRDRAH